VSAAFVAWAVEESFRLQEVARKKARQEVWLKAYESSIWSDSTARIADADKALQDFDKMLEAMKERFG
jgi:hypothetical protein